MANFCLPLVYFQWSLDRWGGHLRTASSIKNWIPAYDDLCSMRVRRDDPASNLSGPQKCGPKSDQIEDQESIFEHVSARKHWIKNMECGTSLAPFLSKPISRKFMRLNGMVGSVRLSVSRVSGNCRSFWDPIMDQWSRSWSAFSAEG